MNAYGARAMSYMRQHRPNSFMAIPNPGAHFTNLGEELLAEVEELEQALAGPVPVEEGYLERAGRLGMARAMAEERVLSDLVYSTWEDEDAPMDETGAYVGGPPTWDPLIPPEPPELQETTA